MDCWVARYAKAAIVAATVAAAASRAFFYEKCVIKLILNFASVSLFFSSLLLPAHHHLLLLLPTFHPPMESCQPYGASSAATPYALRLPDALADAANNRGHSNCER